MSQQYPPNEQPDEGNPYQAPAPQSYPQQGYPQPGYPQQDAPYGPPAPVPGRVMGIVGFILSLLGPLTVVGLIVSIIAKVQSSKAKAKNGFALAGIIIGIVGTIGLILLIVFAVIGFAALAEMCNDLGPGTHQVDGVPVTCG